MFTDTQQIAFAIESIADVLARDIEQSTADTPTIQLSACEREGLMMATCQLARSLSARLAHAQP